MHLNCGKDVGLVVKNPPANAEGHKEMWVWSLVQEDPQVEDMALYSRIIAWKISWIEEPGGLESMGPQRVGHD